MPTSNQPQHTCTSTGSWTFPSLPCPACALTWCAPTPMTYTMTTTIPPPPSLSDADVERIAKRVTELLKGSER